MRHRADILLILALCAAQAGAAPLNLAQDIDGNGVLETDGSILRRSFPSPGAGGAVSFRFAFLTAEGSGGLPDVFRVRLTDHAGGVLGEINGHVRSPFFHSPFTLYDFAAPDVPGPLVLPAAPGGLGVNARFNNGAIGWLEHTFTLGAGATGTLRIEFLVADALDRSFDSALAIDDVALRDASGALTPLHNGGFEFGSDGWTFLGEGGVTFGVFDEFDGSIDLAAPEGKTFAIIATAGEAPAPGGAALLIVALLRAGRRR
ncbi:MAG: hypothetical protein IBJ10_10005 [Phycisphaerales bacterium]|nr:hypothetical protein [Phycisphaerales bacterium]